ncbi:MAG TPA: hypothetical protein VMT89_01575 [Candidatus Acidoferrales bacterium]|nr:hypothetical protein [Candidatus Acidoferrales bacterium]
MTLRQVCRAAATGLLLATFPFLPYLHVGAPRQAHADHAPHYGGLLGMVGDYHIEVLRRRDKVEAFVSDAWRRPVEPKRAWAVFDRATTRQLQWERRRLVTDGLAGSHEIETHVLLADGTSLAITFDFPDSAE